MKFSWFKENKKLICVLLLIFLLGFSIRMHMFKYDYLYGADPYFYARFLGGYIETGVLPEYDNLAYYWMESLARLPFPPVLYWVSAFFYFLFFLTYKHN